MIVSQWTSNPSNAMNSLARCLIFIAALFHASLAPITAQVPNVLLHSILDPSTNAQSNVRQGSSVAVDGGIAVIGVPFDSVGSRTAGTVKVYDVATGTLLHTLLNPNPSAGEYFGRAVAISGSRIVVGADWDKGGTNVTGSAIGAAYLYDLAGAAPSVAILTLTNPTPASSDLFGFAVAISGSRVVITAPGDDTDGTDSGIAHVYDVASTTPSLPQLLIHNPSPAINEGFGFAVAISGAQLVITSPWDGAAASLAGAAYVFDLNSPNAAVPTTSIYNPEPAANDQFGYAVAISGKWVVIGANQDDAGANDSGTAYVYDIAGATPDAPMTALANPSPAIGDNFGFSLSASGTRVAIGAAYDDTGAADSGSTYVFDLASAIPSVAVLTLNNPSPATGDYFGYAVAISAARIIVGAPYDDIGATDAGIAYAFNLLSGTPTVPAAILGMPSPAISDFFARAVAVSGTRVVVGADGDATGATEAGRVFIYDLGTTSPTKPIAILNNPSPVNRDFFGWSVAISGTRVVVGAYGDDTGELNSGIAYAYDLARATPTTPLLVMTNPTPAASDQFGYSVGISGTRVVVGSLFDDTGANNAGSVYVYDLATPNPLASVLTLNNPTPAANDRFGKAVAIHGNRAVVGAYQDDTGAPDVGSAYVYDVTSTSPSVPVAVLNHPSPSFHDGALFGYSVAISEARVVIGAYRDSSDSGNAYVYDLTSSTPTVPVGTLKHPTPNVFDYFAWSVAISGTRILVGAPQTDTGAAEAGSALLYDLASPTPAVPIATLYNPSPGAADYFGWSVAIDGATAVAGAFNDDSNATDRGAAYIFGPQPALTVLPGGQGRVAISWLPTTSNFTLQHATALSPTNWQNAPSGSTNPATIPSGSDARFYRLIQRP